jgi:TrmH family RNA methyltransferase
VIICDACTDIHHPDVIRASVGAFFTVPIYQATTAEALGWCRRHHIRTLAATPHTDRLYTGVDMRHGAAVVVGTEQYGLSRCWLNGADEQIKLPMFGQADSLNVAMSATLLVYEAVRQRSD